MLPQNWISVSKILSFRDKLFVTFLVVVILISAFVWGRFIYLSMTKEIPKIGGEYTEAIVGQPIYVNPLLSQTSQADEDLVRIIYSGLFKYDGEGNVVNDLAESYEVSEDRKKYTVKIREDVLWHDGEQLDVDDVVYTINILQDPLYRSPLKQNWLGVTVSKIGQYEVEFNLNKPYFGFLENHLTLGILPKHIWENIPPERFPLAENNLRPIGSGPYLFDDFQKDSKGYIVSYNFSAFKNYFEGRPNISRLKFNFYPDVQSALNAFNNKEVMGLGGLPSENFGEIRSMQSADVRELIMPRYFAVFINQTKSVSLSYSEVREALAVGTDRNALVERILSGKGIPLYSPLFPQMNGYVDFSEKYSYDIERAKKILDEKGWSVQDDGIRKKEDTRLEFELITTDWPEIQESANLLSQQWKELGVEANIRILPISDFQQNHIRTREYESILIGQAMNLNPDLYSFWHSSQKREGLNLSLFENEKVDELLTEIREESDAEKRREKYEEFQKIISEKNPAIFLYSPYYLYPINKTVKGIELKVIDSPYWRFSNIEDWYVKTKRVKK